MKNLFILGLIFFVCSSSNNLEFKFGRVFGYTNFISEKFSVFSHKKQIIIDKNLLCNVIFMAQKNGITLLNKDTNTAYSSIFLRLKETKSKLKNGKVVEKFFYTCKIEDNMSTACFYTITYIDDTLISIGFRESENGNELVYYGYVST